MAFIQLQNIYQAYYIAAKAGVRRLKTSIHKIAALFYLPVWSGIDSNDLTATDTFIEKMYNTCIPRLETDRDLDIWTPTDTQNHSMELTMHKDAVEKTGHLMILPLIKPENDECKSDYGVTIVEVPCLPPAGHYCGEDT
ncbi:hypothetical protein K439DRAFT_1622432 [Ramaria rubella]|nr:hypothetical protein K439DRAFT_1622432 [Ramaria rubella]